MKWNQCRNIFTTNGKCFQIFFCVCDFFNSNIVIDFINFFLWDSWEFYWWWLMVNVYYSILNEIINDWFYFPCWVQGNMVRWTLLRPASPLFSWQNLMHNPHKRITCIPVIYIQQLDIKYLLNAELSLNFALLASLIVFRSFQG